MWRSPVAHLHGVQGVASSNLVIPTIGFILVIPSLITPLLPPQHPFLWLVATPAIVYHNFLNAFRRGGDCVKC